MFNDELIISFSLKLCFIVNEVIVLGKSYKDKKKVKKLICFLFEKFLFYNIKYFLKVE